MAQRSSVVISDSAQVLGLAGNLSAIQKYNTELRVDRMGGKAAGSRFPEGWLTRGNSVRKGDFAEKNLLNQTATSGLW